MDSVDVQLKSNAKYIISTNIPFRKDGGTTDVFIGYKGFTPSSFSSGVSAQRPKVIFTDKTGIMQISQRYGSENTNIITAGTIENGMVKIKLELGTTATPYTQAPEDIIK